MNGTDHQMPQPWLGRVVAEANAIQDDYEFVVTSLAEYLPTQPTDGLVDRARRAALGRAGEPADGRRVEPRRRAPGVRGGRAFARAAGRAAAARCSSPPTSTRTRSPTSRGATSCCNSAHDSSCACSADEVVDQVLVRYDEARQIGDGLTRDAVHALAAQVDAPRRRDGRREPDRAAALRARRGHASRARVRCTSSTPTATPRPTQLDRRDRRRGLHDDGHRPEGALGARPHARHRVRRAARSRRTRSPSRRRRCTTSCCTKPGPATRAAISPSCASRCSRSATPGTRSRPAPASPRRCGACCSTPARSPASAGRASPSADGDARRRAPVHGDATRRSRTSTCASRSTRPTGTYSIETADGLRVAGLGRLVDGGDGGDTYNYSPPDDDRVVDTPDAVRVTTLETRSGARPRADRRRLHVARVRGRRRAVVQRAQRRDRRGDGPTTLELRAGERFLRVTHELDNRARDHRLRAHFPLPAPVDGSDAECAFAVVHRGLTAEGGVHEYGLPTFPSRRFVDASDGTAGLALVHDGLLEYEVVDDGRELALTLLRSVGYLSRSEPSLRPNPAGPTDAGRRARSCPGAQRAEYAVLLHRGDWRAADCYGAADAFLVPFERARVDRRARRRAGRDAAPRCASTAPRSRPCSASPGGLVVRVFRTDPDAGPGHDRARRRARPRLGRRPPGPPGRPVRRRRSTSAPGRSAPSNSPDPNWREHSATRWLTPVRAWVSGGVGRPRRARRSRRAGTCRRRRSRSRRARARAGRAARRR